jgi:hypothetical protein
VTAAVWVIGALVAAVAIYMRGWTRGRRHGIAEAGAWEALADQLDDGLREAEENLNLAWQAGIVQGQILQADREDHGL